MYALKVARAAHRKGGRHFTADTTTKFEERESQRACALPVSSVKCPVSYRNTSSLSGMRLQMPRLTVKAVNGQPVLVLGITLIHPLSAMNKNLIGFNTFRSEFVKDNLATTTLKRKKASKDGEHAIGEVTGHKVHLLPKKTWVENELDRAKKAGEEMTRSAAERAFNVYRREHVAKLSTAAAAALMSGKVQVESIKANGKGELVSFQLEKPSTTSAASIDKATETLIEAPLSEEQLNATIAALQAKAAAAKAKNASIEIEAAPAAPVEGVRVAQSA